MSTLEEKQLCKIVLEELEILNDDFNKDEFQDSRIRNASSILNKLLNEDNLMKAWRINFGKTFPIVTAPRLEVFINADLKKKLIHGLAGGANFQGIYYALTIFNEGPSPIEIHDDKINPHEYKYKLDDYLEAAGLVLFSKPVSRFTLIRYVANKMGGKHIDFKRSKKEKVQYEALDLGINFFNINGKNGANLELHSIIQALCNSEDIKKLMEAIKTSQKSIY